VTSQESLIGLVARTFSFEIGEADELLDFSFEFGIEFASIWPGVEEEMEVAEGVEEWGFPVEGAEGEVAECAEAAGESGGLGIDHAFGHTVPGLGLFDGRIGEALAGEVFDELGEGRDA
jgi:hypothetical protein